MAEKSGSSFEMVEKSTILLASPSQLSNEWGRGVGSLTALSIFDRDKTFAFIELDRDGKFLRIGFGFLALFGFPAAGKGFDRSTGSGRLPLVFEGLATFSSFTPIGGGGTSSTFFAHWLPLPLDRYLDGRGGRFAALVLLPRARRLVLDLPPPRFEKSGSIESMLLKLS